MKYYTTQDGPNKLRGEPLEHWNLVEDLYHEICGWGLPADHENEIKSMASGPAPAIAVYRMMRKAKRLAIGELRRRGHGKDQPDPEPW